MASPQVMGASSARSARARPASRPAHASTPASRASRFAASSSASAASSASIAPCASPQGCAGATGARRANASQARGAAGTPAGAGGTSAVFGSKGAGFRIGSHSSLSVPWTAKASSSGSGAGGGGRLAAVARRNRRVRRGRRRPGAGREGEPDRGGEGVEGEVRARVGGHHVSLDTGGPRRFRGGAAGVHHNPSEAQPGRRPRHDAASGARPGVPLSRSRPHPSPTAAFDAHRSQNANSEPCGAHRTHGP